jgi:hypothetical protein
MVMHGDAEYIQQEKAVLDFTGFAGQVVGNLC